MLQRMGLPEDVRLACQLRPPPGSYHVVPLLPADAQPADAYRGTHLAVGEERTLAVMFVDLRGFTALSEKSTPLLARIATGMPQMWAKPQTSVVP